MFSELGCFTAALRGAVACRAVKNGYGASIKQVRCSFECVRCAKLRCALGASATGKAFFELRTTLGASLSPLGTIRSLEWRLTLSASLCASEVASDTA